jgi:hypothetical protein
MRLNPRLVTGQIEISGSRFFKATSLEIFFESGGMDAFHPNLSHPGIELEMIDEFGEESMSSPLFVVYSHSGKSDFDSVAIPPTPGVEMAKAIAVILGLRWVCQLLAKVIESWQDLMMKRRNAFRQKVLISDLLPFSLGTVDSNNTHGAEMESEIGHILHRDRHAIMAGDGVFRKLV